MADAIENVEVPIVTEQHPTTIHWVKPASPTRLDGCRAMPIPGMDQIFFPVDATFIFPGRIDIERFKRAVSLTLAAWPHCAGRLKRGGEGTWKLLLNKSPVPITVTSHDMVITEEDLREGHPDLFDRMPWSFFPPEDIEDHPLVRWKITWLPKTGDTVVVIHACHVLGDGGVIAQMQSTVSDFYQGRAPEWPLPTYEKYFELPPPLPKDKFDETLHKHIPNLVNDYDPDTFTTMWLKTKDTTERVDFIFTLDQLRILQRAANQQAGTGNRLSRGDALIAYMITVFNRVYPQKFNQLMNVVHTRGRKSPPSADYQLPTVSAAGNPIFHSVCDPIPDEYLQNLGELAKIVRETIVKVDNYEFLRDCMSVCEQRYTEMGLVGRVPWMNPEPNAIGANLLHRAPFQTAHFGFCANRCRFYTYPANEHFMRVFPANPERLADGSWRDNTGGMHAFFRVAIGYGEKFYETVRRDFEEGFGLKKGVQSSHATARL